MSADPMFVKICGLRDAASARVAVESGADALGFILAPSRRQVQPDAIREIRRRLAPWQVGADLLPARSAAGRYAAAREDQAPPDMRDIPPLVGVVVNESAENIAVLVNRSGIDMIQLSGDESPGILAEIDVPVIKALRFSAGIPVDDALREVSAWLDSPHPAQHVIVEGHADGSYGGTGTRADWTLVAAVAKRYPIVLAGGLDPENVADAVSSAHPFGVDVSSGIETDGEKDYDKIRRFIGQSRQ